MSLAQRYWNFEWDEPTNRAVYGHFAARAGVGANLRVRFFCGRERDLQPGSALVGRLLDHRALFVDEPRFRDQPSTLEAVTVWIAERVTAEFGPGAGAEIYDGPEFACRVETSTPCHVIASERVGNLTVVRRLPFEPSTGLGLARDGSTAKAVRAVAPRFRRAWAGARSAWARALFAALAEELPETIDLHVDLGERVPLRANRGPEGDSPCPTP